MNNTKQREAFRVGDKVWLQLNKERLHGPCKNIKALWYGPFEVLEKVGDIPIDSFYPHTCTFTQ
jgi:hypothetical protein